LLDLNAAVGAVITGERADTSPKVLNYSRALVIMREVYRIVLFLLLANTVFLGQSDAQRREDARAARIERQAIERTLRAYSICSFDDGLRISRVDRIQRGGVKYLARETAKGIAEKGTPAGKSEDRYFVRDDGVLMEGVSRTDSLRIMVDYRKPDYFANIRVDRSLPDGYKKDKEILIRWIHFLNRERDDSETNQPVERSYNGFEAYSTNRKEVDVRRDELGATLLFDDKNGIIVTIYFLNQRPQHRAHKSTGEWKELRERFLDRYTRCISNNLNSDL
jgi:hypothetical protein